MVLPKYIIASSTMEKSRRQANNLSHVLSAEKRAIGRRIAKREVLIESLSRLVGVRLPKLNLKRTGHLRSTRNFTVLCTKVYLDGCVVRGRAQVSNIHPLTKDSS